MRSFENDSLRVAADVVWDLHQSQSPVGCVAPARIFGSVCMYFPNLPCCWDYFTLREQLVNI